MQRGRMVCVRVSERLRSLSLDVLVQRCDAVAMWCETVCAAVHKDMERRTRLRVGVDVVARF